MHSTKHFHQRMGQRGISQAMIDLVLGYGENVGDKVVLNRKKAEQLRAGFRALMKIVDKGGVVVVAEGDAQITTYNYTGKRQ